MSEMKASNGIGRLGRASVLFTGCLTFATSGYAQQSSGASARIAGVVFDSLAGRPLAGAVVMLSERGPVNARIEPASRQSSRFVRTRTTPAGAFAFDNLTNGMYRIAVVHPFLDSLGVGALAQDVVVGDSGTVDVHLATPSLATLGHGHCAASDILVAAFVRDATTRGPLPGSQVAISWLEATHDTQGLQVQRPTLLATADSLGSVYTCMPRRDAAVAVARAGPFATDPVPVVVTDNTGEPRRVIALDLYVNRDSNETAARSRGNENAVALTGTATLVGVVRARTVNRAATVSSSTGASSTGASSAGSSSRVTLATKSTPVVTVQRGARVVLPSLHREATTDRDGRFTIAGLPAGSEEIAVSRSGYLTTLNSVALHPNDTTHIAIVLEDSVPAVPLVGVIDPTEAMAISGPRLVGTVHDTAGAPIAYAQLAVAGWGGTLMTVTDQAGHYQLRMPARDTFVVTLRHIGHTPQIVRVDLTSGTAVQWNTTLAVAPQPLAAIRTTARAAPDVLAYSGFYDRMLMRQKGLGTGVFITEQEIKQRNTSILNVIDRRAPGIFLAPNGQIMGTSMTGGYCPTVVYLDGQRVPQTIGHSGPKPVAELDDMAQENAVAGIEIYSRGADAPGAYQLLNGMCGVILIWTK